MTRRLAWTIAVVVFAVVFEVLDYLAGFNAGIAVQWLVIAASALVAFAVLLAIALCVVAMTPQKGGKR